MTKKRAIEAAMKRLRAEAESRAIRDEHGRVRHTGSPLPSSVEREIKDAYEAGRIAGLREAAALIPNSGMIYGWFGVSKIRGHARALAKKARAGK